MSLTLEQNEQLNQVRNQLINMMTVIDNIARSAGVGPTPREGEELAAPVSIIELQPPVYRSTGELVSEPEVIAPPPPFLHPTPQPVMYPNAGPPPAEAKR